MTRARSGRGIAVVLGALTLALLTGLAATSWESILDWWYRIPVTRTWGDLLRSPRIEIEGALTARLGIERARCPAGSGVLIYGLVEGDVDTTSVAEHPLGPLSVRLTRLDGDEARPRIAEQLRAVDGYLTTDAPRLFLRALSIPTAGEYRVSIRAPHGSELGRVSLTGTDEAFQPWLTFGPATEAKELERLGAVRRETIALETPEAAIPRWDGILALGELETRRGLDRPETPLPRLWPDDSTPRLRITPTPDGELDLVAPAPLQTTRAHTRLLARWWIGGRPFPAGIADLVGVSSIPAESFSGRVTSSVSLRLRVRVERAVLGAAPEERIELQLLYAPRGWRRVLQSPLAHALLHSRSLEETASLFVSDRVELALPED